MKLGSKTIAVILLCVGLVLVNFLALYLRARIDLTGDRIFTLSDGTESLLSKVEEPIALQLYYTRSASDVPIQYKNYATRVEEMLRQYVSESDGKVSLRVIDPRPDTDDESAAKAAGLTAHNLPNGETFILGLVATQAAEQKTIEFFDPTREPFLEYDLSQLIYSVQQFNKPKLGLITSLPLRADMSMAMMGQPPQQGQVALQEWERSFEIVSVEASADTLPDNLDVLAVIHPQNVTDKMQFAIDQFLLRGKPVFIAVDPSSTHFKNQQRQQQMMMGGAPGVSSSLPKLFDSWGITYDSSMVVGDLDLAAHVQTQQGPITYPIYLRLKNEQINSTLRPTANLSNMVFVESGALEVAADRGYEITPIAHTTERSGMIASMMLGFTPPQEIARQVKPDGKQKTLAVMLRGNFKTAFPDGAPKTETPPPAEGEAPPPAPDANASAALKESSAAGTLVVVADTDFLLDSIALDPRMLRFGLAVPSNDNLAFASNTLEFLGSSQDLIAIRGKGTSQREFDVIRRIELAAQERYQQELQEAEKAKNDVTAELNKLLSQQTEGRQLIATPEIQQKLQSYREQEAQLQRRVRDIRRSLREDVEHLNNRVSFINTLSVPLLILVGAIVFLIRRNRRQRAA